MDCHGDVDPGQLCLATHVYSTNTKEESTPLARRNKNVELGLYHQIGLPLGLVVCNRPIVGRSYHVCVSSCNDSVVFNMWDADLNKCLAMLCYAKLFLLNKIGCLSIYMPANLDTY